MNLLGQYINFGKYYEEPLLWRIVSQSEKGDYLLLCEDIIELKPFDINNSNSWEQASLNRWLNSTTDWLDDNYQQLGFLSMPFFDEEELNCIKPVIIKDTSVHSFILSKSELMSSYKAGYTDLEAYPLERIVTVSKTKAKGISLSKPWWYWLRPERDSFNEDANMDVISASEKTIKKQSDNENGGIRPALYLKKDVVLNQKRDGSPQMPHKINKRKIESYKSKPGYITFLDQDGREYVQPIARNQKTIDHYDIIIRRRIVAVVISQGVEQINARAFRYCKQLELIYLPISLKVIDSHAFESCNRLKYIQLPKGIQEIEEYAFSGCVQLEYLEIPTSIKKIDVLELILSARLKHIRIPDKFMKVKYCDEEDIILDVEIQRSDDILTQVPYPILKMYQKIKNKLVENTLHEQGLINQVTQNAEPRSITYVEEDGRMDHIPIDNLNEITKSIVFPIQNARIMVIPEGVTHIGENAFRACEKLIHVVLPNSLEVIEAKAFCLCSQLKTIKLPVKLRIIGEGAFCDCQSLTDIRIPGSVAHIGNHGFDGCSGLTNLIIEEGVTSIGKKAFSYCDTLITVEIPKSVRKINAYAFECCTGLKEFLILSESIYIGREAFRHCESMVRFEYEGDIQGDEDSIFWNCGFIE